MDSINLAISSLVAVVWPHVYEWMKRSSLPVLNWVNQGTVNLNRWIQPVVALVTVTLGFQFAHTGTLSDGLTWTITVPALNAWLTALAQWGGQQLVYSAGIETPRLLAEMKSKQVSDSGTGQGAGEAETQPQQ
jgi:ABC-type amino acid transport system permease subunit